jgi:hypothetical protein
VVIDFHDVTHDMSIRVARGDYDDVAMHFFEK